MVRRTSNPCQGGGTLKNPQKRRKEKMKKLIAFLAVAGLILSTLLISVPVKANPVTMDYGDVTLSGGLQAGHFDEVWDLTAGDLVLSFTYDANGLVDDFGSAAHAWAALGVRTVGYGDFNPTWMVEGAGVWLATDYDWAANTFDPDPPGSPTLDLDDKLILQKAGGHGEGDYNLPSTPPNSGANHRIWFDRDGVDQWQAQNPLAVDGGTYNTYGRYEIVITLHATGPTTGEAYMTVNGLDQGFETDGNWNTMELSPAGMTFTGDMSKMQVFYGLYGYGATHSVAFKDITVTGCLYREFWVKASGGGEFYDDWAQFKGNHCTIGLIGMSLSAVPQGSTTDYKGSGTFVDHDEKIVISLDVTSGWLTLTGKKEVQFWGIARVKDIDMHDKWIGTFWIGLVDDAYGVTNRFALHVYKDGAEVYKWHGTLLPGSEVTVWFWE